MSTSTDGAHGDRRAQLLDRLLDYSTSHGLSEVSLRPLAGAVGSSPRMLLYFFGSKEELVREVLRHSRGVQLRLLADTLAEQPDRAAALCALWAWISDPAHHNLVRFFFECYARSLHDADAWRDFGQWSVTEWLPHITAALGSTESDATLVLAAIRGLMLDLLATGETDRVNAAFERLLAAVTDRG